jgi:oxalate decarboxylase/phosphoglucose isomerase-like protein (cupin superfamily)
MKRGCLAVFALLVFAGAAFAQEGPQLETPRLREPQQRALFQPTNFKLKFTDSNGTYRVDNAAALQLQLDKGAQPFLSTLPAPGSAQFLTALKPCGILAPHIHPRGTEIYSVIYGNITAGIAQENNAAQNISFSVGPGEIVAVPQGLLHFNYNGQCSSSVFFQSFNNGDPGTITVGNALAALGGVAPGSLQGLGAAYIFATNTGLGSFAIDGQCLQRCNLPSSGGTLNDVPDNIKVMLGLPASTPSSANTPPSTGTAATAAATAASSATASAGSPAGR